MTNSDIQQELNRRKYPQGILDADDFQGVVDAAVREMQKAEPLIGFVSFHTALQVTDYYVFDANDTQTRVPIDPNNLGAGYKALCANALEIRNVYWNPGGDWSSLNLFSPGWQMLSQMVLFTGSYFHMPSQMTVLRQKLDTWQRQFGSQGFEVIGQTGNASAYLRLYPIPEEEDNQVFVEYLMAYTAADIGSGWAKNFMMLVEAMYCEALANYYSQTAGLNLLGFVDNQAALKYWSNKYEQKWERVTTTLFGPHGEVLRS